MTFEGEEESEDSGGEEFDERLEPAKPPPKLEEETKEEETKDEKPTRRRGLLRFMEGLTSSLGRAADRYVGAFIQQIIIAFLLEAWDHNDVRNQAPRHGLIFPEDGRTPWDPASHVRQKTEFLYLPIAWLDSVTAWLKVKENGRRVLKEVPILQPYWLNKLGRKRLWTLWAKYGPLHLLRIAEGRAEVRQLFPGFDYSAKANFVLIRDPYHPTSADMYKAMNPVLANVPTEEIAGLSRDELAALVKELGGGALVEWFPMNGFLQNSWLEYIAVEVAGGALETGAAWNPYATVRDPHANDRHRTLFHAAARTQMNERGRPVQVDTGLRLVTEEGVDDEGGEESGGLFRTEPLTEPRLKRLIDTPEVALQHYKATQGYRFDFDPDPVHCRTLDGEPCEPDSGKGLVPDTQRMAEVLYQVHVPVLKRLWLWGPVEAFRNLFRRSRTKDGEENRPDAPLWTWGPSHSATELVAEMPAEEMIYLGKLIRHRKLLAKIRRHWSTGELSVRDIVSEVANWLCTGTPRMAEKGLSDAKYYAQHLEWVTKFAGSGRDGITKFTLAQVKLADFRQILAGAPEPVDFWALCEELEYFHWDPLECWYGYDADGTPRVPQTLLTRLVKEPSLRGINMASPDGGHVLEQYRGRPGVLERIQDFWLRRVTAEQRTATWEKLEVRHGLDFLTMARCIWQPMETSSDLEDGLLHELLISQSGTPLLQLMNKEFDLRRRLKEFFVWPHFDKIIEDMPVEVIMRIADEIDDLHRMCDYRINIHVYIQAEGGLKRGVRGWQQSDADHAIHKCKYGARINKSRDPKVYKESQRALFRLKDLAWRCKQVDLKMFWVRSVVRNPFLREKPGKIMDSCSSQMASGLHPEFALGGLEALIRAGFLGKAFKIDKVFVQQATVQEDAIEKAFQDTVEDYLGHWPTQVVEEERAFEMLDDVEALM